jgi:glutathione S-transferase
MYKAVGAPGSRLTRVTWMLEELGQDYEIMPAKMRSETMLRYNPTGKVPALVDGDLIVTDSAAICAYLGEKHADAGMGPNPGLAGRAEMMAWMIYAQSEFEAPLWMKTRHKFILPEELRANISPAAAHDFAGEVEALDAKLGDRSYALGDRFSAVDVILGHCGRWARGARFEIRSARVNAYIDRVLERPALARAIAREKEAAAA